MKFNVALLVFLSILLSTGCSTIEVDRYRTTADNQQHIKRMNIQMNVEAFTATMPKSNVMCRMANKVGMPDGETFERYIQNAIIEELKMAGLYSKEANVVLSGHLVKTDVSSGMTDAHWTFNLKVSNSQGESFTVTHSRQYDASFLGGIACANDMPRSFMPSVQELVGVIVNHSEFSSLFDEKNSSTIASGSL